MIQMKTIANPRADDTPPRPRQPVGSFAQEAENLCAWVEPDKGPLVRMGLSWYLVESLPARIQILRQAEARWKAWRMVTARKLRATLPDARALRNEIDAWMRFACRESPELLVCLDGIPSGQGQSTLAQALNDLAVFGREHPEPLISAGLDMKKIDAAALASERLARLLSERDGLGGTMTPKDLRDRAYADVRRTVQSIRAVGRFVFRHQPERLKGYLSEYNRRHRGSVRGVPSDGIV